MQCQQSNAHLLLFIIWLTLLVALVQGLELVVTSSRLPTPVHSHAVVYDGQDSIYVIGGLTGNGGAGSQDKVIKYNLGSGVVEVVGNFTNVASGVAVLSGDDIIYFGGQLPGGTLTSNVYRYSLNSGTHSIVNNFPTASAWHSAVWDSRGRYAYIFGGWDEKTGTPTDDVYRFNAITNQLDLVSKIPSARVDTAAVWDTRRHVTYVLGGYTNNGSVAEVLTFHPPTNVWTHASDLPTTTSTPCSAYAAVHDKAFIMDGQPEGPAVFDASTGRSESVQVAAWERFGYTACVYVPKLDRVYVLGGRVWSTSFVTDLISYVDLHQLHD